MTAAIDLPTAFVSEVERAVWARDGQAIKGGAEVRFLCPSHPDKTPSARYSIESRVWRCDACTAGGGILDLGPRIDVAKPSTQSFGASSVTLARTDSRLVAEHEYTDEGGKLLSQVLKYEPKRFAQRAPDGLGGWSYRLDGVRRVLYKLPNVATAIETGLPVVGAEGEKDADSLISLGLCGTTSPMGAGKFRTEYAEVLRGAEVWWFIDNDEQGRKHGQDVAQKCAAVVRSFKILEPPAPHKDVSDWIDAGATREDIERLANATDPYEAPMNPEANKEWDDDLVVSAADFVSQNQAPHKMLVEGIWPEHAIGFISASPKSYKTYMALDLAFAVATGTMFLGRFPAPSDRQRTVLFIQEESSRSAFRDRLTAVGSRFGGVPESIRLITNKSVVLEDESWVERIEAALTRYKPDLVVLDPLASLTSGDENSSQEMGRVVRLLRGWRDRHGCAICVVHHSGKGSEKGGSKRSGEKMRGSSALHGASETALYLDRADDETPRITVKAEQKEDEPPKPFLCEFRSEGAQLVVLGDAILGTDDDIRGALSARGEATIAEVVSDLDGVVRAPVVRDRIKRMRDVSLKPGTGVGNKAGVYFLATERFQGTTP